MSFVDLADAALFWACLLPALRLTDAAMRANLATLPKYTSTGQPVTPTTSPGKRLLRVDAAFATEAVLPLVLQGALLTCYCIAFYLAAQVVTLVAVYVRSGVRAAMNGAKFAGVASDVLDRLSGASPTELQAIMEGLRAGKPYEAIAAAINGAGPPTAVKQMATAVSDAASEVKKVAETVAGAQHIKIGTHPLMHALFENALATATPLVQLSAAMAVITVVGMGVTVMTGSGFEEIGGHLYVDAAVATRLSTATTASAVPAMIVLQVARSGVMQALWARLMVA